VISRCRDLSHLKQRGCGWVEASAESEMLNVGCGVCLSIWCAGRGNALAQNPCKCCFLCSH